MADGPLGQNEGAIGQVETQMQEYARTSGLSFTSEKENLAESRLKELQDALDKAKGIAYQPVEIEVPRPSRPIPCPKFWTTRRLREYRQRLTELQRQYAELSATWTPQHYKVQRVQAQIDELKRAMQGERGNVVHRIGNEYSAALRRETLLSKARDNKQSVADHQRRLSLRPLKRDETLTAIL